MNQYSIDQSGEQASVGAALGFVSVNCSVDLAYYGGILMRGEEFNSMIIPPLGGFFMEETF